MSKVLKITLGFVVVLVLVTGGYFGWRRFFSERKLPIFQPGVSTSISVFIPPEILTDKFGFLSAGPEDAEQIKARGQYPEKAHPITTSQ